MDNSVMVCLKTISDIQAENIGFYIDAYQRGYRWTRNEVRSLLEDIREFSQDPLYKIKNRFYCLQPIIVTKRDENQWKVIDGQQRLTTLYLIYIYYINNIEGRIKSPLPFSLNYKNKEKLEECLTELSTGKYYEEENFNLLSEYLEDIDCYFIIEAYKEICEYFAALQKNPKVKNHISDMKTVFDNFMKVIWYELINCSNEQEITIFTKVNIGKIPLTNAELIKALLLKDEGDDIKSYQENIAVKWDEIEAKLLGNDFWSFLANENDKYSTRIDFIFDIMANEINELTLKNVKDVNESFYIEKKYNEELFSFYVFNNYLRYLQSAGSIIGEGIKIIWDKICEYYRMFNDWYSHRTWYHLIGFIIYNSGKKNIDKIYELCQIYKTNDLPQGHKTFFESELKRITKKNIPITDIDENQLNDYVSNLSYDSDSKKIKEILLLYNLAVLEVEEKTDVRFDFDKFKKKNAWDIEHINATADGRPADESDTDSNECLIWLQSAQNLPEIENIKTPNNEKIKDLIKDVIDNKLYLSRNNNEKFILVYETTINYFNDLKEPNSIGNLTLLDAGINRSYKNDVFPAKRKKIIERCCSEVYIPLGTKKVFLKAYLESKNLLKWTQEDCEYYIDDIVKKISTYLDVVEEN